MRSSCFDLDVGLNLDEPDGDDGMSHQDFPYRSLSSIARSLLPKAKEMHERGMSWTNIARQLKVSSAALFIWRKIESRERASPSKGAAGGFSEPVGAFPGARSE